MGLEIDGSFGVEPLTLTHPGGEPEAHPVDVIRMAEAFDAAYLRTKEAGTTDRVAALQAVLAEFGFQKAVSYHAADAAAQAVMKRAVALKKALAATWDGGDSPASPSTTPALTPPG